MAAFQNSSELIKTFVRKWVQKVFAFWCNCDSQCHSNWYQSLQHSSVCHHTKSRAEHLNDSMRASLIMTPQCPVIPAWSEGTPPSPLSSVYHLLCSSKRLPNGPERKTIIQEYHQSSKSPGLMSMPTVLLKVQCGMEEQEFTSRPQEAEKTESTSLLVYTPRTTKRKQKPWKQQ